MIKKLTVNAKKPTGFWGKLMIQKMNRGHEPMTIWAIEHLPIQKSSHILDIGCGGGNAVKLMSAYNPKGVVYGIDYSPLSVKSAKKKNKREIKNGTVHIQQASVSDLPYTDNTFDMVTAFETIYFWPNPQENFKEIYRVIKPNGTLAVVCEMIKNEDGTGSHTDVAEFLDLHYFTQNEINQLFIDAGFKHISAHCDTRGWLCMTGQKEA